MKGAVAIIVILSATALLAAADEPVAYDPQEHIGEINDSLRKVTVKTSELAREFMSKANKHTMPPSESGKFALASQLIGSAGNLRHVAMLEAADSGVMKGIDFKREIQKLIQRQCKADSLMDAKLEALIKLAPELPKSGLYRHVMDVIEGLQAHLNFLNQMLKSGPKWTSS